MITYDSYFESTLNSSRLANNNQNVFKIGKSQQQQPLNSSIFKSHIDMRQETIIHKSVKDRLSLG
jgi:hypothetical protein